MKSVYGLLALFVLLQSTARGEEYFVDFLAGDDSNDGLAIGSAFKRCPGDAQAEGMAARTVLAPGDVVRFRGGVLYQGRVEVEWQGESGRPIVYDGNEDGGWGRGRAVFDLGHRFYHAFHARARDYIQIVGFEFRNAKNGRGNADHHGIVKARTASSHWVIRNCIFRAVEDWQEICPVGSNGLIKADHNAIDIRGANKDDRAVNILIKDCEFSQVGRTAVSLLWTDKVRVEGNDFGGSDPEAAGFFSVALRIGGPNRNIRIVGNTFHEGWQYEGDEGPSSCHAGDWIHVHGDNDGIFEDQDDPHHIVIEKNLFYNDHKFRNSNGTAMVFLEQDVYNVEFRGNTFLNPHRIGVETQETRGVLFLGNTMIGYEPSESGGVVPLQIGRDTEEVILSGNRLISLSRNTAVMPLVVRDIESVSKAWQNIFLKPFARNREVIRVGARNVTMGFWTQEFGF